MTTPRSLKPLDSTSLNRSPMLLRKRHVCLSKSASEPALMIKLLLELLESMLFSKTLSAKVCTKFNQQLASKPTSLIHLPTHHQRMVTLERRPDLKSVSTGPMTTAHKRKTCICLSSHVTTITSLLPTTPLRKESHVAFRTLHPQSLSTRNI